MLSPSHTPQPSSQRPSLPQVTVTTVFDNGRVTLLECQIPEIGYHRWDLAEKCFGSPVPALAPEDGKRLGERFHSPEQPTSTIDDALRQYIGTVRYEARLIKVKQPNSVYTLFENDQPLYTATASFTAYDPNQSLQNVGGHIVWELADGRHPTILVDGQDLREALGADALYAPYGIDDMLVFILKKHGEYTLIYDNKPIAQSYDEVSVGYCCESAAYTIQSRGGVGYWFWAQRQGYDYLVLLKRK